MSVRLASFIFAVVLASILAPTQAVAQIESIVQPRNIDGRVVAKSEREEQAELFDYYFEKQNLTYETRLDKLKTSATVPGWRIPYSAHIYPQTAGGMGSAGGRGSRGLFRRQGGGGGSSVLTHYDQAFNGGAGAERSADAYEVKRLGGTQRIGLFGLRTRSSSESWEGYCSGFTAAAIRHPEPVRAVDAGQVGGAAGVVFQPSDIKALLSCIYNRTTNDSYLFLAPPSSRDGGPNMATFHLTLANYIGQAGCPVGINRTKGEATWNNPVYTYESTISDGGESNAVHYKNVHTTITYSFYASDAQIQTDEATGERRGNMTQSMDFNYTLALDGEGRIIGGRANSFNGHFLWIPLYAVQGRGEEGKAPGNPYIDVRKVIDLARLSALPEVQKKYDAVVIGPRLDPALTKAEDEAAAKAAAEKAAAEAAAEKAKAEKAAAEKAKAAAEKAVAEKVKAEKAKADKAKAEKAAAEKVKADKAKADKVKADKAKADKAAADKDAAKKTPADAAKKAPAAPAP